MLRAAAEVCSWRRLGAVAAVACALAGCGAAPSEPSLPPVPAVSGPLTLSGTVVGLQTDQPVSGAILTLTEGGLTSLTTGPLGDFSTPASPGLISYAVSASGHLTHESRIQLTQSRSVRLDVIATSAPFDLSFYRELARDGFESPTALKALKPWTVAPGFYLRTVTEDTGLDVPSEVIDGIKRVIAGSVPELSGGRFAVAELRTGTAPGDDRIGWVNVRFLQNHTLGLNVMGRATVGGDMGYMELIYDPDVDAGGFNNPLHCESATVEIADHEIVHTMGFWHTASTFADFHSGVGCPGSGRPERTRYHANIVYSRPPGNRDPDIDPTTYVQVLGLPSVRPPVVVCLFSR